ncbi:MULTISPECIES: RtcB family protein [unclassified Pseudonocardia]|uniref:RtcB family protein n=1 Tax=unclassified Pseudonocardia TaxID=2619320 RepID=UPI00094AC0B9|nr:MULTISPECIES: RtcB family protein [unclassified Pseudonocardia]OLL77145.1 Protein RtcB [Pseudonocardia sp. Ae150A_Ps1]OLL88747.1 Protein RtcB [Pseudonocardia sp. Ae263_Ps1]OLL91233.1 Protein RtcB [Pseudonocardia sp. Ae356_Ps1]
MFTLTGTAAPVRLWTDPESVEPGALTQLRNCAALPWTHGVAVMPDVHQGYGATVGSVVAMRDAVSPGAVGVDIGCGMSAVRTDLTAADLPDSLARVRSQVERDVPVGRAGHRDGPDLARLGIEDGYDWTAFWTGFDRLHHLRDASWTSEDALRTKAHRQLGSLGSGNHFLELCTDGDDRVWLMLHSGSRGIGNVLANLHIEKAKELPHNQDLPDRDLAVFLSGTPQMDAYRADLFWVQEYARLNRHVMMRLFEAALARALGRPVAFEPEVSCHHNYVSEETYDGVELVVTRKGAISTEGGRRGIIPGSMGTGSFIVSGLAAPESYCSASHGAGRRMSRGAARRQFSVADLQAQTEGVECRKDAGVLDEIPGAYKDLDTVMSEQTDLVRVEHRLRTILCVKG